MWRSKKFIIGLIATVLLVSASIGGVALAQTGDEEESQLEAAINTLWDKVATILQDDGVNITSEQLKDAFSQAQSEIRNEALKTWLQSMVAQDKITQEQADDYIKWIEAKPDVPFGFGFKAHGGFRGMGGMRGWGRLCIPTQ